MGKGNYTNRQLTKMLNDERIKKGVVETAKGHAAKYRNLMGEAIASENLMKEKIKNLKATRWYRFGIFIKLLKEI